MQCDINDECEPSDKNRMQYNTFEAYLCRVKTKKHIPAADLTLLASFQSISFSVKNPNIHAIEHLSYRPGLALA